MKRITLIALATAGLTFAAAPSYAQSSFGGSSGQNYGNTTRSPSPRSSAKARSEARHLKREAEAAAKFEKIKADAMKAEASDKARMAKAHSSATDASLMKDEKAMIMKDEKVTMVKSESMRPTNCPAGTDPQDNGTCRLN